MAVTLQKWGNSVGVRLPKPMLEQVGLKEGAAAARHVRYLAGSPPGLVEAVLERVAAILSP
jgi:hypothetical protein